MSYHPRQLISQQNGKTVSWSFQQDYQAVQTTNRNYSDIEVNGAWYRIVEVTNIRADNDALPVYRNDRSGDIALATGRATMKCQDGVSFDSLWLPNAIRESVTINELLPGLHSLQPAVGSEERLLASLGELAKHPQIDWAIPELVTASAPR